MQCSRAFLLVGLLLCSSAEGRAHRAVPDFPEIEASLAFTCVHEKAKIPPRDPEADQLYQHARWIKKNNLLKPDVLVLPKIARLLRIATAYGHDLANLELRQMIGKATAWSADSVEETLDLTQELIDRGIPGGYYDMARHIEYGYGVKRDRELALKYYRKSADLGNPFGQYAVAEFLAPAERAPEIAIRMWRCAAEQGHGEAGLDLGTWLQGKKNDEAVQALQFASKAGNSLAASRLSHGFNGPPPTDEMHYLGQKKDEERYRRYYAISTFLSRYSYLNPKVPEIDRIVPLPPARLPAWDGSFQWLKEHEANLPPPLPTEERLRDMARAKNLDPETGRPVEARKSWGQR